MRAAYVTELGPAESIRVGQLPTPVPGPTDVLVAVETVAVNPVDTYVRAGGYRTRVPLPLIIGRDLVGVVAAADAATGFSVGERVWCNSMGHDGRQGPSAEFAVVPAERLYRLPAGVDPALAVAVAHPAGTAYLGWFVHAGLLPGETVFVGGGAGNVGTAAIELAATAGARVLASARPEDHDHCRAAGAEEVFDYRDPALAEHLQSCAPEGLDVVWDTSGQQDFRILPEIITPGGRVLITAAADPEWRVPFRPLYTRNVSLRGFVISRATVPQLASAAALINRMLAAGQLTARIAERLPLEEASLAHQRLEAGEVKGRLLLDI